MKLGNRLRQLEAMVASGYDHIWDCCCDHGLLGASLLARHAAPCIHFVDIVPALMQQLACKLQHHFPQPTTTAASCRWQLHCHDVAQLSLAQFPGRQLVIMAGVGGELMARLVCGIIQRHPAMALDFLLCPTNRPFTLRSQLIALDVRLQRELLITERQRHYELLLLSTAAGTGEALSPVGEQLWLSHSAEQAQAAASYLRQTLQYYQRMQPSQSSWAQQVVDAYQQVRLKRIPSNSTS